jgi:signal transduction histidine kinase
VDIEDWEAGGRAPGGLGQRFMSNIVPNPGLSKRSVAGIIGVLSLLTLVCDLVVPEDLDLSVFYALSIAAFVWVRSPRLLWFATGAFIFLVFADLYLGAPPVHPDDPWWLHIANRSFVAVALLVLATIVHLWTRSLMLLEESRSVVERRVAERTREFEIASQQRREAETALHHVQKLEAVGQLTGGVAHDFNNLLTVIAGNADMLRRDVRTPRDRRRLTAILQAADMGEKLVRQLLAFSRRQALQPEVLDLRARTRDLGELLARSLREDIRIELTLADDLAAI